MATTTNYSWTTPDDTALVKDGAAAIRTLGSSADTTVKALNPGTTAGDVDYYTAATTKARIAIGTAGQVLTVNSGATAPEWATPASGGMTLLSTTSLTGATTTISSISTAYNVLYGVVYGVTNATGNGKFRLAPNGTTNITQCLINNNATSNSSTSDDYLFLSNQSFDLTRTDADNILSFHIYNYASSANYKSFDVTFSALAAGTYFRGKSVGSINTNTAITSLVFSNSGGNLSTGTVLLYGVK